MNLQKIINLSTLARTTTLRSLNSQNYLNNLRALNGCNCGRIQSTRLVSTIETKSLTAENGILKKMLNKIPFLNVDKMRTQAAAYILYEQIADKINYLDFFEKLELPDTFYSWFVVIELHIWMLSVRAMAEGDSGRILRNSLVEALWADVATRVKKLGAGQPSEMRAHIYELAEQLQASLIAYDEGLQSDDCVLAGAIWRRFYNHEYTSPENLEVLVRYVRKNLTLLDHTSKQQLWEEKVINWEPLSITK